MENIERVVNHCNNDNNIFAYRETKDLGGHNYIMAVRESKSINGDKLYNLFHMFFLYINENGKKCFGSDLRGFVTYKKLWDAVDALEEICGTNNKFETIIKEELL